MSSFGEVKHVVKLGEQKYLGLISFEDDRDAGEDKGKCYLSLFSDNGCIWGDVNRRWFKDERSALAAMDAFLIEEKARESARAKAWAERSKSKPE